MLPVLWRAKNEPTRLERAYHAATRELATAQNKAQHADFESDQFRIHQWRASDYPTEKELADDAAHGKNLEIALVAARDKLFAARDTVIAAQQAALAKSRELAALAAREFEARPEHLECRPFDPIEAARKNQVPIRAAGHFLQRVNDSKNDDQSATFVQRAIYLFCFHLGRSDLPFNHRHGKNKNHGPKVR